MSNLSGDISAAVDNAAAEQSSANPSDTPATTEPTKATPATSPVAATAESGAPDSNATDPAQPVPATAEPGKDAKRDGSTHEPPEHRWPQILDNARTKERTDVFDRYGLSDEDEPSVVQFYVRGLRENPVETYHHLGRQLQARGLLQSPSQTRSGERPKPALRSEDGREAYDAEGTVALIEALVSERMQAVMGRIEPLEQTHQQMTAKERKLTADTTAKAQYEEALTWEGFEELAGQIHDMMRADGRVTLDSAYNRVYQPWIREKRKTEKQTTREQILAEIEAAPITSSSTVKPGQTVRAASGDRKRGRSLSDDVTRAVEDAMARVGG